MLRRMPLNKIIKPGNKKPAGSVLLFLRIVVVGQNIAHRLNRGLYFKRWTIVEHRDSLSTGCASQL